MDFDLFGMGGFSLEDMACDILMIGPAYEDHFDGEALWQSTILSPMGYEISVLDYYNSEEKSSQMQEEYKKIGIFTTKDGMEEAEKCKVISVVGLYDKNMMSIPSLKEILMKGKESNALVCVDPGEFENVEGAKEILVELGPYIDYFLPNETEAKMLSGQTIPPMIAQEFQEMGIKNVVITTGMNGCFVRGDGAPFAMGAIWGDKKDLTGAGANFAAGLIHGLFQDWQLKTVCEFATGCAAACIQYEGPVEKARDRKDEVKKILNNPYI